MADGSVPGDFLGQYRVISNKLKKRFLRKPNVTEASDQFGSLAVQCENAELPHYAGLCWSAAARCEGSLGNTPGEAWTLLRAGRQFLAADVRSKNLGCLGGEHLQGAVSCFTHAATRWQHHHNSEQPSSLPTPSPLSAGLGLELANSLQSLDHIPEATTQYKHVATFQTGLDKLNTLGSLASCKVKTGDFDGALNVFNEMAPLAEVGKTQRGVYADILRRCEVSRVLLLLILQPTGQKLSADLARLLEKYAWGQMENDQAVEAETSLLGEDQFILMQSLVMATQSRDVDALAWLETELWTHLSVEQRELLRTLVRLIK